MTHIRQMTFADLPVILRLKEQAGWNQTEADVARVLILQPDGGFLAEYDGRPAGTVTTCVFGSVGWIAMMLVDASLRGRGIGRALMNQALEFLEQRGVRSMRLDATPMGQPLYEKLGFVADYQLGRLAGMPIPPRAADEGAGELALVTHASSQIPDILRLDRAVTATDREKLLTRLFAERPDEVRVAERAGGVLGYLTSRPGSRARFIGPCIAQGEAGPVLLADALQRYAGQPVFVDVPLPNAAAVALAEAHGLTVQRYLLRMGRGEPVRERVSELWASSGPEKG